MVNSDDILIDVQNVSKKFCRDFKRSLWYGVQDTAGDVFNRKKTSADLVSSDPDLRPSEFWANKDISFQVRRGECLGLIGHNGAGKTTLLKMLNGLIKPDTGSITMKGRIGALIALGAGFNPILTGRENIYVNGSILGLSRKEIDAKIDEIIDFAEIEDAIDAPVRTYSSGMQVRLGFAVAAVLIQPDVLIIDEVLAVGDASFQSRCARRVSELLQTSSVILVSHQLGWIERLCSTVVCLQEGKIIFHGETDDALQAYQASQKPLDQVAKKTVFEPGFDIQSIKLSTTKLPSETPLAVHMEFSSALPMKGGYISVSLHNDSGAFIGHKLTKGGPEAALFDGDTTKITIALGAPNLTNGLYSLSVTGVKSNGETLFNCRDFATLTVVESLNSPAPLHLG